MTQKKLVKIAEPTANLSGLNDGDFIVKADGYGQAMLNKPLIVPGIKPTAVELIAEVDDWKVLQQEREQILKDSIAKTEEMAAKRSKINHIIAKEWLGQVQIACKGDIALYKELGYGTKGVDNGTSTEVVGKASESTPIITNIEINSYLQHKVHISNNMSMSEAVPADASALYLYEQIGGVEPLTTAGMQFLGAVKNAKFITEFQPEDLGKTVYYMAVYIDRKTNKPLTLSPVAKAVIN